MKKIALLLGASLLFAACSSNNTTGDVNSTPAASTEAMASSEPLTSASPLSSASSAAQNGITQAGQAAGDAMENATKVRTVSLSEQSNSGQSGTAILAETKDGKVNVTLNMKGGNFTQPQPAHIHLGSCPTPGAIKYSLNNVVNGKSETVLNVNMDTLLAAGDKLAVNVHKSAADVNTYTACGNVK